MIYAKHHVRYRGKMYRPGEALPAGMTDKEWQRLQRIGAIDTVHDPVDVVLEDEPEDTEPEDTEPEDTMKTGEAPHQPPSAAASPQGEASDVSQQPKKQEKKKEAAEDGAATKRGGRKPKDAEASELDAIAGANTVVEK